MQYFLQKIVNEIELDGDDIRQLKDHCYVFPTRRAGVYFKKYLTKRFANQPLWSPHVFSIVEFTEFITDKVVLDPITLIFELFRIYQKHEPDAQFDDFYAWGQIILKDFDEVDKYLVDAQKLFTNLKDIKEIEDFFELPEDQLLFLQQFWRVFENANPDDEDSNNIEDEFIRIWEVLGTVYQEFKQSLYASGAAYEGMAQREIVEGLDDGGLQMPFKRIVFAGFNALTTSEKRMFDYCTQHYDASIYWDTDLYYLKNYKQEAGKFVRRYYDTWKNNSKHNWTSQTNLNESEKNIHLIGVPLKVGQAKYAGQLIEQLLTNKQIDVQDTAIVLGDESMLFPVLYSLPTNVPRINITMGYPLKDSPLYRLLEMIVQLQKTRQDQESKDKENPNKKIEKTTYYSKIILQILNNPFIKSFAPEAVQKYMEYLERNNIIYTYAHSILHIKENGKEIEPEIEDESEEEELTKKPEQENQNKKAKEAKNQQGSQQEKNQKTETENAVPPPPPPTYKKRFGHPIFELIFQRIDGFTHLIQVFNEVLVLLFKDLKSEGKEDAEGEDINTKVDEVTEADEGKATPKTVIELEFIYHLLKQLHRIEEILLKYRQAINIDTFWKLFREVIQSVKLPFTGEPLRGLQIMGFLETRTLDFKNLIVLGMNEGVIPSSSSSNTFIPFNLRKGMGMPTFLDQDAIYAYHFYHLLQRAENVHLLYNTEVGKMGSGEKSRFLLQIEEELGKLPNGNIKVQQQLVSAPMPSMHTKAEGLQIEKTDAVMETLHRYVVNMPHLEEVPFKKLAPTAMTTYITCPVQFYFKYVAKLYELEQVDEDISPKIFGDILHKTIELIYQSCKQDMITEAIITKLLKNDKGINAKLNKAFKLEKFSQHKEGKNLLLKKVIKRLVIKILQNDKKDTPFRIVDLEGHPDKYTTVLRLHNDKEVAISGIIDRVDEVTLHDGTLAYRIIDYKTGMVKMNDSATALKKPIDQYIDKYFSDPNVKAGFQAYLYSYLFWRRRPQHEQAQIIAGIYSLKEINKGILFLRKGEIITNELFQEFERRLIDMLSELFDQNIPFIQAEDEKRYSYSAYRMLVGL